MDSVKAAHPFFYIDGAYPGAKSLALLGCAEYSAEAPSKAESEQV